MANTFDTPILVTEAAQGRFRLFRGGGLPAGVTYHEPTSLAGLYQISGPLEAYYRLSPPQEDLTREEVLSWLQRARMLGCQVREVEREVRQAIGARH